jgi:hypothetical protein
MVRKELFLNSPLRSCLKSELAAITFAVIFYLKPPSLVSLSFSTPEAALPAFPHLLQSAHPVSTHQWPCGSSPDFAKFPVSTHQSPRNDSPLSLLELTISPGKARQCWIPADSRFTKGLRCLLINFLKRPRNAWKNNPQQIPTPASQGHPCLVSPDPLLFALLIDQQAFIYKAKASHPVNPHLTTTQWAKGETLQVPQPLLDKGELARGRAVPCSSSPSCAIPVLPMACLADLPHLPTP